MGSRAALATAALALLAPAAGAAPPAEREAAPATRASLCLMVESAAKANGLPVGFLTRVIWRESNFAPAAVGPVTRTGARALGIAQFMPESAAESGLADPFDPVQALPKAAELLSSLAERFGNLGLAAAAYNAGPRRVQEWLAGSGSMRDETRRYVLAITGRSVEDWSKPQPPAAAKPVAPVKPVTPAKPEGCASTLAAIDQPPGDFAFALIKRVTAAVGKPWGVELAAGFSRERVLASYARAMQRLSAVIAQQDPILTRGPRAPGLAPFYQARIGADTRPAAESLCARIRRAGGACLVLRTRGG
jgi:hypothetical protein